MQPGRSTLELIPVTRSPAVTEACSIPLVREPLGEAAAAGFTDTSVTFTNEAATGMHSAIIRAVKPAAKG